MKLKNHGPWPTMDVKVDATHDWNVPNFLQVMKRQTLEVVSRYTERSKKADFKAGIVISDTVFHVCHICHLNALSNCLLPTDS